jgi:hypothetical protein
MNMRTWNKALAGATLAAVAAGCGGGGSGDNTTARAGIDGGGFAKGTVTGFGSVIVNGVRFDTASATFQIDGRAGTQADLRVGDVVSVTGSINGTTGVAQRVTFDDDVEGPVQEIDRAAGTLVVLGQRVIVDGATSFDDTPACTLADIQVGTIVEVSGFRASTGEVRATRIECRAAAGEFEVTGSVSALDTVQRRFRLDSLTVDYSQAQLDNFPGGAPANGHTVEVKGTSFDGTVLVATRVEFKAGGLGAQNGDRVEIEGLVTRFVSPTDFDVSGQRVTTSGSTLVERCATPLNLALNSKVEVEGTLSSGTINATKIECNLGTSLRVLATVESIDAAANSFVVLGVTVTVDASTRFEDKSDLDVSSFRLTDLRVGDFVEVRGGAGAVANTILAALVERDDPENRVELRGAAVNVLAPDFTILGVTVHTTAATEFRDEADAPIAATQFFAQAPDRLVNARGTVAAGTITADEVELEN